MSCFDSRRSRVLREPPGSTGALVFLLLVGVGFPADAANPADSMARRRAAEIGLAAGMVLDRSSAALARDLLPPEILGRYEADDYRNAVVEWPSGRGTMGSEFETRTRRNGESLAVDERGMILERASGTQPLYVYGTPFPKVDADDPRAGVKIVWNMFYGYWWNGNSHNVIDLVWLDRSGIDRKTTQEVYFKYYDGLPPQFRPAENPNNLLMQFLALTASPADLYGTTALAWRYRDSEKRDAAWAYVPALRRVRGVSPSNRSDGFLGSDMSQDDGPFFDGKPEDFDWSLVGEREILRLVDPALVSGEGRVAAVAEGGWRALLTEEPVYGYDDPSWRGAPWAPIHMELARRRVWIVEGVPHDRYYLHGKIQLWIDAETWQGAFNRKFSWQGELLNTSLVKGGPAGRYAGEHHTWEGPGISAITQIAENGKMDRATVAAAVHDPGIVYDRHVPLEAAFFDYQTLYRFGK